MKLKEVLVVAIIVVILFIGASIFNSFFQECKTDLNCINKYTDKQHCLNRQRCVQCVLNTDCPVGQTCDKRNFCTILS